MRSVLLLATKTGWAEAAILDLPVSRFVFYMRELSKGHE